jgi:hypothetical protein
MTVLDEAPSGFKAAGFVDTSETLNIGMSDTLGKEVECRTCGDTFVIESGRPGRPPTQCDNCKGKKDSAPKGKPGRQSGIAKLEESLATQLVGMGGIIGLFQPFDGLVISANAPATAAALAKLADRDPRVRKALEKFVGSTAYGELAFVLFATVAPILANHGVVPPQMVMMGKVPDEAASFFIPGMRERERRAHTEPSADDNPIPFPVM